MHRRSDFTLDTLRDAGALCVSVECVVVSCSFTRKLWLKEEVVIVLENHEVRRSFHDIRWSGSARDLAKQPPTYRSLCLSTYPRTCFGFITPSHPTSSSNGIDNGNSRKAHEQPDEMTRFSSEEKLKFHNFCHDQATLGKVRGFRMMDPHLACACRLF